jgi:hypothetical protein
MLTLSKLDLGIESWVLGLIAIMLLVLASVGPAKTEQNQVLFVHIQTQIRTQLAMPIRSVTHPMHLAQEQALRCAA